MSSSAAKKPSCKAAITPKRTVKGKLPKVAEQLENIENDSDASTVNQSDDSDFDLDEDVSGSELCDPNEVAASVKPGTFFTAHDGKASARSFEIVKSDYHTGKAVPAFVYHDDNSSYVLVRDTASDQPTWYRGVLVGETPNDAACYVITDVKGDEAAVKLLRLQHGLQNSPVSYRYADLSHNMFNESTSLKTPSDTDKSVFGDGGIIYGATLTAQLKQKRLTQRDRTNKQKTTKITTKRKKAAPPSPAPASPKRQRLSDFNLGTFTVTGKLAGFELDVKVTKCA